MTEADLERELTMLRAEAAGRPDGVFGPGSMVWYIDREAAMFLAAGRALLLQLAHPWVAAAIAEHSRSLADPIGRFHRTFGFVLSTMSCMVDEPAKFRSMRTVGWRPNFRQTHRWLTCGV